VSNEIQVDPIDKMDIAERTSALREDNRPLPEIVCYAAADYQHALNSDYFAAAHGGVEKVQAQLFKLVNEWVETLTYVDED